MPNNMLKKNIVRILAFSLIALLPSLCLAGETAVPESVEDLRAKVEILQQEVARLEEENKGLSTMLKDFEDDEVYLVVDTESNRLTMRQGKTVLHKAVCGTGSRVFIEGETGRNWYFETPMGSFTVLGKERNPVWIRPDWSYVEENMPIPPADDPDRFVRGVLGKYALLLGNGYKIHVPSGRTFWERTLPTDAYLLAMMISNWFTSR
jgi:hypothetical protein